MVYINNVNSYPALTSLVIKNTVELQYKNVLRVIHCLTIKLKFSIDISKENVCHKFWYYQVTNFCNYCNKIVYNMFCYIHF